MHYLGLFCANGETKVIAGVREQINAVSALRAQPHPERLIANQE